MEEEARRFRAVVQCGSAQTSTRAAPVVRVLLSNRWLVQLYLSHYVELRCCRPQIRKSISGRGKHTFVKHFTVYGTIGHVFEGGLWGSVAPITTSIGKCLETNTFRNSQKCEHLHLAAYFTIMYSKWIIIFFFRSVVKFMSFANFLWYRIGYSESLRFTTPTQQLNMGVCIPSKEYINRKIYPDKLSRALHSAW